MIKFTQTMTVGVGEKSVTFTGREPFPMDDADLKKNLIAIGTFTEQENGDLVYSGKVSVPMADGKEREVDARGFIACQKSDLKHTKTDAFR